MGRPSSYTPELAELICSQIADGHSLKDICLAKNMPSRETVRLWLLKDPIFLGMYARAREEQADHFADEIIEIADAAVGNPEEVQAARLRVDSRKWAASKMAPKKYGDKVTNEQVGPDGGPVRIVIEGDDKGLL